ERTPTGAAMQTTTTRTVGVTSPGTGTGSTGTGTRAISATTSTQTSSVTGTGSGTGTGTGAGNQTSSTGAFDKLSPGGQKIATSLFNAQNPSNGTSKMSLDQIAALKGQEGWGRVFKDMKSDGLVQAKNLGQVVSGHAQTNQTGSTGSTGRMSSTGTTSGTGSRHTSGQS